MYVNFVSAMRRAMRLAGTPYALPRSVGTGLVHSLQPRLRDLARRTRPARAADPSEPPAPTLVRTFSGPEGMRRYTLYLPASAPQRPRGLIVMLHGCTQSADDFAAGTAMNEAAERHGLAVAYPIQERGSNASSCWNWFSPQHQLRDGGEPAIIAGIARALVDEFSIDRDRVFVAGLSAGGAMAAIMARTHPDLFTGVGVHSGLCYGCAKGAGSAFAAMRSANAGERRSASALGRPVRTIIFHGMSDRTVAPANGDQVFRDACAHVVGEVRPAVTASFNGRTCRRTTIETSDGYPLTEYWQIEGGGHAWSGGRARGSFTDTSGPDASAEMVRFFLAGPARPAAAPGCVPAPNAVRTRSTPKDSSDVR